MRPDPGELVRVEGRRPVAAGLRGDVERVELRAGQRRRLLDVAVGVVGLDLVARACLPREAPGVLVVVGYLPRRFVEVGHVRQRRRVGVVEQTAGEEAGAAVGVARVEPQVVAHDRAAERRGGLPRLIGPERAVLAAGDAPVDEVLVHVVGQPARVAVVEVEAAGERVASLLGDHVHPHAARLHLGRVRRVVVDVLGDRRILRQGPGRAVERHLVHVEAVDVNLRVVLVRAVDGQPVVGHAAQAARVDRHRGRGPALDVHGGDQQRQRVVAARGREHLEDLAVDRLGLLDALDVDGGTGLGDDDRLLERTDRHLAVDVRGEPRAELHPLADERAEARQRERHGVVARLEGDDEVLAVAVGDGGPDLLDEGRAARLDRDPGQDAAGRVGDRAADGLRMGQGGRQQQADGAGCRHKSNPPVVSSRRGSPRTVSHQLLRLLFPTVRLPTVRPTPDSAGTRTRVPAPITNGQPKHDHPSHFKFLGSSPGPPGRRALGRRQGRRRGARGAGSPTCAAGARS